MMWGDIPIGAEVEFKVGWNMIPTGRVVGRGQSNEGPFYEIETPAGIRWKIRMDLVRVPGKPWPEELGGPPPTEESPSCRTS